MALTTGKRDGWPYADLHVKPYAQRHVKVYADRAALEVNPATVARVRMRYVAAGLEAAVYRKPPARSYRRRLDGEQEARLVALTCSAPPQGHKRWRVRLLADRLVALGVVESVSYETVRQALKQTGSSRG
jgi:hypothetical protein